MRPIVIVSGVLGGGSALVFAVAALVATLVPSGTLVPSQGAWGGEWQRRAIGGPASSTTTRAAASRSPCRSDGRRGDRPGVNDSIPESVSRPRRPLMRPGLVVTGVLGAGTVLVFGLAALVATLFPNGTLVNSQWNGGWGGGWGKPRHRRPDADAHARARARGHPGEGSASWRRTAGSSWSSTPRRPRRSHPGAPTGTSCPSPEAVAPGSARGPRGDPPYTQPAMRFLSRFFDTNDRELSRIQPLIDETNELEGEYEGLDRRRDPRADRGHPRGDRARTRRPRSRPTTSSTTRDLERRRDLAKSRRKRDNERLQGALDDVVPEVFAAGREAMKRTMGMRQYDVQLMGAHRAPPGQDRRDADGRGQDPHPDAGRGAQRPDRPRRPRRHRQRLPGPPRRPVDGARRTTSSGCRSASSPTTRRSCSSPASRRPTSG